MRVYQVKPDYKYFGLYTWREKGTKVLVLDGSPRLATWTPLSFEWDKPNRAHANIEFVNGTSFAIDEIAHEALSRYLSGSCEFLPLLPNGGTQYYLLNVLVRCDCLSDTTPNGYTNESPGNYTKPTNEYKFLSSRIPAQPLFLLPMGIQVMTSVGRAEPELEFRSIVESKGLSGVEFKLVWTDEGLY